MSMSVSGVYSFLFSSTEGESNKEEGIIYADVGFASESSLRTSRTGLKESSDKISEMIEPVLFHPFSPNDYSSPSNDLKPIKASVSRQDQPVQNIKKTGEKVLVKEKKRSHHLISTRPKDIGYDSSAVYHPWNPNEIRQLQELVGIFGKDWKMIAKIMADSNDDPIKKSPARCQLRWALMNR